MIDAMKKLGDKGYVEPPDDVGYKPVTAYETSAKAQKVADDQMSGLIPDDVQAVMDQKAAEITLQSGGGVGSMFGKRSLRDFGIKALEYQQQGVQNTAMLSELEMKRLMGNEELRQKSKTQDTQFDMMGKELDQKWATAMSTMGLEESKQSLAFLSLQSANRNYLGSLENQLLIANSQNEIGDMETNLAKLGGTDTQPGYFEQMNQESQSWLDRLSNV